MVLPLENLYGRQRAPRSRGIDTDMGAAELPRSELPPETINSKIQQTSLSSFIHSIHSGEDPSSCFKKFPTLPHLSIP